MPVGPSVTLDDLVLLVGDDSFSGDRSVPALGAVRRPVAGAPHIPIDGALTGPDDPGTPEGVGTDLRSTYTLEHVRLPNLSDVIATLEPIRGTVRGEVLLNEAGSAEFLLPSDDEALDELALGDYVRISQYGRALMLMRVERKDTVRVGRTHADLVTRVSGPGNLAELEKAVVYPALGLAATAAEVERVFSWTDKAFDYSAWRNARQIVAVGQGTIWASTLRQGGALVEADAWWIAHPYASQTTAPTGTHYLRSEFDIEDEVDRIVVYAACDDEGIVYLDGRPILEPKYPEAAAVYVDVVPGTHHIGIEVTNRPGTVQEAEPRTFTARALFTTRQTYVPVVVRGEAPSPATFTLDSLPEIAKLMYGPKNEREWRRIFAANATQIRQWMTDNEVWWYDGYYPYVPEGMVLTIPGLSGDAGNPTGAALAIWAVDASGNRTGDPLIVTDDDWHVTDPRAGRPGMTPGAIMVALLQEAQSRGTIPHVTIQGFGARTDSGGRSWPETTEFGTRCGTNLYTVMEELGVYAEFRMDPASFRLTAWATSQRRPDGDLDLMGTTGYGRHTGLVLEAADPDDPETGNLREWREVEE